jgi:Tfp pilus assembly protein PilF
MTRRAWLVVAALAVLTVAAYWQAGACGWVAYDDTNYVTYNPMVKLGLREAAVYWACSAVHGANWHPITSLSHIVDCTLFGLDPAGPHWENVAWHALNAVLVFIVWRRLGTYHRRPAGAASAGDWPAAFVAALFALHPLHVESVAWVSERKDVLSTAFWLLAILAYTSHHRPLAGDLAGRRRAAGGTLAVLLCTALALLAKPMTVTLPFTLLLLDYWPLRRWPARSWRVLVREKAPLFALVLAASVITLLVQRGAGATHFGAELTLGMRLGNAFVACARYLGKMLWPAELACFYPHPGWWPWWAITGSVLLVAAISALAWRERARRPWLAFGWCWFLGTLVPVIGLVQVGAQSMADRYTYVPLLGIFTILAWAGAELAASRPRLRPALAVLAALAIAACFLRTWQQIPVWRTPLSLIEHLRAVTGEHAIYFREIASALAVSGRPPEESIEQYRRGFERFPDHAFFATELGMNAARAGRFVEALALLERARTIHPDLSGVYHNLGDALMKQGRLPEAERQLRRALEIEPDSVPTLRVLADVLIRQDRVAECAEVLRAAVAADRWDWKAWNALALTEDRLGRRSTALAHLERAVWINPSDETVVHNLQVLRGDRP